MPRVVPSDVAMVRRILFRVVILTAVSLTQTPGAHSQTTGTLPDEIRGYGDYHFGMSAEEAMRIDPRAKLTECGYVDAKMCLERDDTLYGERGRMSVLLADTDQRILRINLIFDRSRGAEGFGACGATARAVFDALFTRLGTPTRSKPGEAHWVAPRGGGVSAWRFCRDADAGVVVVTYKPSRAS